jgi:hypothetical protein
MRGNAKHAGNLPYWSLMYEARLANRPSCVPGGLLGVTAEYPQSKLQKSASMTQPVGFATCRRRTSNVCDAALGR